MEHRTSEPQVATANRTTISPTPTATATTSATATATSTVATTSAATTPAARPSDVNFEKEGQKLLAALAKQNEALHSQVPALARGGRYAALHLIYTDEETGGRVYCGNLCAASNLDMLRECGINNVVNCQGARSANNFEGEPGFFYKRFQVAHWRHMVHKYSCSALEFAMPTFKFIDAALARGEGTLIHCLAGAHRAGTTTVAFLMYKRQLSQRRALEIAKELRPVINPMAGLVDFLDTIEPLLLAARPALPNAI